MLRHLKSAFRVVAIVLAAFMGTLVTSSVSTAAAPALVTADLDCLPVPPSAYIRGGIEWNGNGDRVFVRDQCADGWAVRVSVWRWYGGNTGWEYTGLTHTDYSAAGDGGWKGKDLTEGVRIKLHGYLVNKSGTKCELWIEKDVNGNPLTSSNNSRSKNWGIAC